MTLKDHLGPLARTMFASTGVLLLVASVASAYSDWPIIVEHKASSFGLLLTLAIALPVGAADHHLVVDRPVERVADRRRPPQHPPDEPDLVDAHHRCTARGHPRFPCRILRLRRRRRPHGALDRHDHARRPAL
ncbi:MAG: hypothetical protein WDN06_15975 [Asticcacaulis sp.]